MKDWIEQELSTANLGDKRLVKRMKQIIGRIIETPMDSIKSAFKGWEEVMGAYRFFNNQNTSVESILSPHQDKTLERVKEHKRVLIIQDTTELDYSSKKSLKGTGPLSSKERQGFFAHNHLVISSERLALGVWKTDIYARDEEEHGKSKDRKQKSIEEKESFRWLQGYREACILAEKAPDTQVISCSDREGDIYEIFEEWQDRQKEGKPMADWLIRCNQNRILKDEILITEEGDRIIKQKIEDKVEAAPLLGAITFDIKKKEQLKKVKGGSRHKKIRSARTVIQEIRATKVTLKPPYRKGKKLPEVSFYVVMAKEKDPPEDEDPIDWILLTSIDVPDFETAKEIIELYLGRWEIEVFHRVLKTGCRVEELQLKKDDRTKVAIALYMIIAWRILYIMKLGRECPNLPCDVVFEEDEWQSLWVIAYGKKALESKPSLGEFVRKVAEFGGFLGRKGDGNPGPQAIWKGLRRVRDFTIAWQIYVKHHKPLSQKT